MKTEKIIRETQKNRGERDLDNTHPIAIDCERKVSKQNPEYESLKRLVAVLKSDLSVKRSLYVSQQHILDNQKKELSETKTELESINKTCSSMQKEIENLQRKLRTKDTILKKKREQINNAKRECEQKDLLIKTLINELGKLQSKTNGMNVDTLFIKTDQLIGLTESGSQITHTNNK